MNAKQRAQNAYIKLLAKVQAALTENPQHFGFRVEPPDYGIHDEATYSANDLDQRPDFVKRDDETWDKL